MIVKIVALFLAGMAILAMFGRLRMPGGGRRVGRSGAKCPRCGRPRIGTGPCPCGKAS